MPLYGSKLCTGSRPYRIQCPWPCHFSDLSSSSLPFAHRFSCTGLGFIHTCESAPIPGPLYMLLSLSLNEVASPHLLPSEIYVYIRPRTTLTSFTNVNKMPCFARCACLGYSWACLCDPPHFLQSLFRCSFHPSPAWLPLLCSSAVHTSFSRSVCCYC